MALAEETVYEALRKVQDPELLVNVVDLGLIYGIGVEQHDGRSNLLVIMTMTTPACPYGPELLREVKDAMKALEGVGKVEVQLTLTPPWTPDRMTDDARDQLGLF
jgi:metal-sulfur cluster biosynthetic enzyme